MSDKLNNENDGFPQADQNNLTREVRLDINDLPPSQREKQSFIEQFKSQSKGMKITAIGAVAIVFLIVIVNLFGGKDEVVVQNKNELSGEDKMRNQRAQFDQTKKVEEKFVSEDEMEVSAPDPDDQVVSNSGGDPELEAIAPPANNNAYQNAGNGYASNNPSNRSSVSNSFVNSEPSTPVPAVYVPSRTLEMRMSEPYRRAMEFYTSQQVVYSGKDEPVKRADLTQTVDKEYSNLYDGAGTGSYTNHFYIPAGGEMRAVLDESIDTDYPSIIRATVIYPSELTGSKVLVSYQLGNERVSANVEKLVLPDNGTGKPRELTLQAVVRDGLPGIGGDVNHHWGPQIVAGVANVGVAGAAAYYAAQQTGQGLGGAVIAAPVIEKGAEGALRPINYFGRQRPITVKASAGQEFTIIVTTGFEVML